MYKTREFLIIISILISAVTGVEASSLSESFRSFILDETGTENKPVAMDGVSQQCMSCHNGSLARHIKIKDASKPMQFTSFGTRAHPVGMQYANYAAQQPHSFRKPAALNPQILLVDGRVGCLSCHRLKQNQRLVSSTQFSPETIIDSCTSSKILTVDTRNSTLCMSCHIR